jgi:hypothetical protein
METKADTERPESGAKAPAAAAKAPAEAAMVTVPGSSLRQIAAGLAAAPPLAAADRQFLNGWSKSLTIDRDLVVYRPFGPNSVR